MDCWNDLQILISNFDQISSPAIQQIAEQSGFPNNEWRGWLLPAYYLAPDILKASDLRIRSPYTNPAKFNKILDEQFRRGMLTENNAGYQLAPHARKAAQKMIDASRAALVNRIQYSNDILIQIVQMLQSVYSACLASAAPQSKWCLLHNRDQVHLESQPAIIQFDQLCSDMAAWRDDCHIGAWQPYHYIQGYIWEVFSLVWRSGIHTLDEICQTLCPRRGYSTVEYLVALDELKLRGWLFDENGHFYLTPAGITIRQLAEDYTDELFYAPFYVLSDEEHSELDYLLSEFIESTCTHPAGSTSRYSKN